MASRSVKPFCRASPCAQHTQTDRHRRTTLRETSVAIGRIPAMFAMHHNDVRYPSIVQHVEIASGKFRGDDAAGERRGTEATCEENTFDAVTSADEMNTVHQVQYKAVQPR